MRSRDVEPGCFRLPQAEGVLQLEPDHLRGRAAVVAGVDHQLRLDAAVFTSGSITAAEVGGSIDYLLISLETQMNAFEGGDEKLVLCFNGKVVKY